MQFLRLILCLGLHCASFSSLFASGENSIEAIQSASKENKYLFIFFYKGMNEKTIQLQKIFDQTMQKLGEQSSWIKILSTDPNEKSVIDRFNLKRTPMPFVLVLAPNGAITGGFTSFTEEQLVDSFTSIGAARCLKALQERKLVLLCLQNNQTINNDAALKGVKEFKADQRFTNATEVVIINPSDKDEHKFLNQLSLDTYPNQAITVLISPPAEIIGTYQGPITKEKMLADLQKASSDCCGSEGCCPGGSCPGGKCGSDNRSLR